MARRKPRKKSRLILTEEELEDCFHFTEENEKFARFLRIIAKNVEYNLLNLYMVDPLLQKKGKEAEINLSLVGVAHDRQCFFSTLRDDADSHSAMTQLCSVTLSPQKYDLDLQNYSLLPAEKYFPLFGWEKTELQPLSSFESLSTACIPLLQHKDRLLGLVIVTLIDREPAYSPLELELLNKLSQFFKILLLQQMFTLLYDELLRQNTILRQFCRQADQDINLEKLKLSAANIRHAAETTELQYRHEVEKKRLEDSFRKKEALFHTRLENEIRHYRKNLAKEKIAHQRAKMALKKEDISKRSERESKELKNGLEAEQDSSSLVESLQLQTKKLEDRLQIGAKKEEVLKAEIVRLKNQVAEREAFLRNQIYNYDKKVKNLIEQLPKNAAKTGNVKSTSQKTEIERQNLLSEKARKTAG